MGQTRDDCLLELLKTKEGIFYLKQRRRERIASLLSSGAACEEDLEGAQIDELNAWLEVLEMRLRVPGYLVGKNDLPSSKELPCERS